MDDFSLLELADWRRQINSLYVEIRHLAKRDPEAAHQEFRQTRDWLFKRHPASPLDAHQRDSFHELQYFRYDPNYRVLGNVQLAESSEILTADLPEGQFLYKRFGDVDFELLGETHRLALYWVMGYGGGLFIPFRDGTSGDGTYGAGRYLFDAIKGADLGTQDGRLILDFNFAYNPSCAYNERWVCPLAMRGNTLDIRIEAGEKLLKL